MSQAIATPAVETIKAPAETIEAIRSSARVLRSCIAALEGQADEPIVDADTILAAVDAFETHNNALQGLFDSV